MFQTAAAHNFISSRAPSSANCLLRKPLLSAGFHLPRYTKVNDILEFPSFFRPILSFLLLPLSLSFSFPLSSPFCLSIVRTILGIDYYKKFSISILWSYFLLYSYYYIGIFYCNESYLKNGE